MIRLLKLVFKVVPGILKAYFSWIVKYSKHKERYPIGLRFYKVQQLVRFVILKMGVKYDMDNFNDIYSSEDKKFIVCNHQSMFDCLLFLIFAKRPLTFVAKKETAKMPFVGKLLKIIDGEFFDRDNLKTQIKNVINTSKLLAENKYDVVIFPEGTRQKEIDKGLLPFHAGSFKIPLKSKSNIILSEIYGSYRCLKFFKFPKEKQLYVQFNVLEELKYEEIKNETTVSLMEKSKQLLENQLEPFRQKDEEYQKSIS